MHQTSYLAAGGSLAASLGCCQPCFVFHQKRVPPLSGMAEMLRAWPRLSEERALQINRGPGSTQSCSQGCSWGARALQGAGHGRRAGAGAGEMLHWSPLPSPICSLSNPLSSLSLQVFRPVLRALHFGCCSGLLPQLMSISCLFARSFKFTLPYAIIL